MRRCNVRQERHSCVFSLRERERERETHVRVAEALDAHLRHAALLQHPFAAGTHQFPFSWDLLMWRFRI